MRFTFQHPSDPTMKAIYGHDRTALGYFLEVRRAGRLVCAYDGLRSGETTIDGVLSRLVDHTFVTEGDIGEAMTLLAHTDAADIEDPALRRAATVIERLRQAGAGG